MEELVPLMQVAFLFMEERGTQRGARLRSTPRSTPRNILGGTPGNTLVND